MRGRDRKDALPPGEYTNGTVIIGVVYSAITIIPMNAQQSSFKTCYISAPLGATITSITHALDRLNVKWEWANSRNQK